MKELQVTWKSTAPLLMHSCQGVNPLHPLAKELKRYTGKRTKTDEDYEKISDLEWELGLYWKDGIGVYVPAENVEATIMNGGKANKKGADIRKFTKVMEPYVPLLIPEPLTKDQLRKDPMHRDLRTMRVQKNTVMRTRPRFNTWEITFTLSYDENRIDVETIATALEFAGKYVGLCDSRPRYGTFVTIVEELR